MTTRQEKTFERLLPRFRSLPSLPSTVTEVLNILNDPRSSAAELCAVIGRDQSLTTRLLGVVNSAYYGFPRRIVSLNQAVTILGYRSIYNIVLATKVLGQMKKMKGGSGLDWDGLWLHALSCGVLAQSLGETAHLAGAEELFLAGLMHDIGKVALAAFLSEEYVLAIELAQTQAMVMEQAELSALSLTHAQVGLWLAEHWNLPPSLTKAIGYHHAPQSLDEACISATVVHVADVLARSLGSGNPGDAHLPRLEPEALNMLGLRLELMEEIILGFDERLDNARIFLEIV